MAQLLDNVLDSLQQKLETQLDSAVGIDLKTDRETESDEDEPADVKALRARVRKAEADAKALLNEGADLSTKLGRSEQRNKTLRAELADRERILPPLEKGDAMYDGPMPPPAAVRSKFRELCFLGAMQGAQNT